MWFLGCLADFLIILKSKMQSSFTWELGGQVPPPPPPPSSYTYVCILLQYKAVETKHWEHKPVDMV